jgi:carbon-monoxide dehydrogenase medium subunit
MYPPKFDYYRASSVEEAISLLQTHDGAKLLAGGHSLVPVMKMRLADPGVLIDIGRIDDLSGIKSRGSSVTVGALTTHAMVAASEVLPDALTQAAGWIGDPMVRNRGTVGGNLAHADPASDLPTVMVALGATFELQGPAGKRMVGAEDFFVDFFTTALADDELIVAIHMLSPAEDEGSAYAKLFNPASRYAMVGAAAVLSKHGKKCSAASVAIGGLTPMAQRCPAVEAALSGQKLNAETIAAAAAAVVADLDDDELVGDIHASAAYRKEMAPVIVARALTEAADRA